MSHCLNRVPTPFTGEGAAPLSKPNDNTFKAAAREKRVTF